MQAFSSSNVNYCHKGRWRADSGKIHTPSKVSISNLDKSELDVKK